MRSVRGVSGRFIQTGGNNVHHLRAVTLHGSRVCNRFARLFQVQQFNRNRLLITLRLNRDLITTTILLVFVQTVPLYPIGGQCLTSIITLGDGVVFRLQHANHLRPQSIATTIFHQQ
ncbi:Uncharacterised protein [Shigella sonnei]|nr:Uncharacterised protein [Shigella sonnei]CSF09480.1 Uncharacterised protein [Shigella sonnei]CSG32831.1 Uncharacterised protein [Shigella sonnei]